MTEVELLRKLRKILQTPENASILEHAERLMSHDCTETLRDKYKDYPSNLKVEV